MLKTKKAVARRFRLSKKGRLKRQRPGRRHLLTGKPRSRKRRLRRWTEVSAIDRRRILRFLPHG